MGNKDYLFGGVIWVDVRISQGNVAKRNKTKKSENDYIIMPENFNKNLEQKKRKRGGPEPTPPPPPQKKKFQIWICCQNSLTRDLKIRVVGFVLKKL